MDLSWTIVTVVGLVSVAGLPFVMAWVERMLMTGPTHVKQPPH